MGKGIILGIDFSTDYTQLAYIDDEGNPRSISIGTEDNYLIPTAVCYNSELNEWSAGEEALNKSKLASSKLYNQLTELLNKDTDNDEVLKIMSAFMSYLLKIADSHCNGKPIKNILVTLDEVNPQVMDILMETIVNLGYGEDDVKIISHSESFVYYMLNQNKDIWINQVYFINLNKYSCVCRKLNVVKGREPHVAGVNVEDLSDRVSMKMLKENPKTADNALADYMEEKLSKHVISGVYLSGQGFYEGDFKNTISSLSGNRRIFKGNNLIVKGAAYAAREFFHIPVLGKYLISCKGRTKVRVTMAVKYKERENTITLSNVGDYWYQARSKAECIMEQPTEAQFEIHDIMNHRNESFKIDLTQFPERPEKTTRIQVNFRYLTENKFEIEIQDLGFGDFFEASDMVVKKEITIE